MKPARLPEQQHHSNQSHIDSTVPSAWPTVNMLLQCACEAPTAPHREARGTASSWGRWHPVYTHLRKQHEKRIV